MAQHKILVAEDEDDIRFLVKTVLETKGYEVVEAYDGLSALDAARTESPDIMLLDIMLPVYNGVEVLEMLHADEATSGIRIIMMSALTNKELIDRAKASGAVGYIEKPFDPDKLEEQMLALVK